MKNYLKSGISGYIFGFIFGIISSYYRVLPVKKVYRTGMIFYG